MNIIVILPIDLKKANNYDKDTYYNNIIKYRSLYNEPKAIEDFQDEDENIQPFEDGMEAFSFLEDEKKEQSTESFNYTLTTNTTSISIKKLESSRQIEVKHECDMDKKFENFNCWWCCYKFDTDPVYIPKTYKDGKFGVYGNFCSFNCALSYNADSNKNYFEYESLLYLFYKRTNDIHLTTDIKIPRAPRREILRKFGGCISIEDYRKNFFNHSYNMTYPPYTLIIPELEEIVYNDLQETYTKDTKNDNKKDDLVLRRKTKKTNNILDIFS